MAGLRLVDCLTESLDGANSRFEHEWGDENRVANFQATISQSSSNDRATAFGSENTVDKKPWATMINRFIATLSEFFEGMDKLRDSIACWSADSDNGGIVEKCPRDMVGDIEAG